MITLKKKNEEAYKVSKGTNAFALEYEASGLSQNEFSKALGTSRQNIGRWLKGREPNGHAKTLLNDVLGISPGLWLEY